MTRDVVDVGRLIDAARRHWRGVAAGAAIGALIALAYARTATPRYEAASSVRIDVRPSTLPTIYADQAARDEIFTEIEVLRSRTIAADVVDSLALAVEMEQPRRTRRSDVFTSVRQVAPADVDALRLVRGKDGHYRIDGTEQVVTPGTPVTAHGVQFVLAKSDAHPGAITLRLHPREATIESLLEMGLSRVVLGTSALKQPEWFRDMIAKYPGKLALGIDARDGFVATHGWLETSSVQAVEFVQLFANDPLAAIIYTDIATDGMLQGPNVEAMREMQAAVSLPVVASGGVTTAQDVADLAAAGLHSAIIGRALYAGTLKLKDALAAAKTPVASPT